MHVDVAVVLERNGLDRPGPSALSPTGHMDQARCMGSYIVVGIDGSAESVAALRWAIAEAALRHVSVKALHCWAYPTSVGVPSMMLTDVELMRKSSVALVEDVIAQATAGAPTTVAIDPIITEGSASHALIDASDGAELVVVGARGHGGFLGLLIGSVANQVVHHAACPVVVIPKPA